MRYGGGPECRDCGGAYHFEGSNGSERGVALCSNAREQRDGSVGDRSRDGGTWKCGAAKEGSRNRSFQLHSLPRWGWNKTKKRVGTGEKCSKVLSERLCAIVTEKVEGAVIQQGSLLG